MKPEDTLTSIKNGGDLLDQLSIEIGQSLRIIAPPVTNCLLCKEKLSVNNKPTQIVIHTQTGPKMYSKYILYVFLTLIVYVL